MSDTILVAELNGYPIFPFADEFPYISDDEMLELAQDIEENGMHHPIVLFKTDGPPQILDGRNRLRACAKTKLSEAPVEWYEGDDPIGYVIALNMLRRHLTVGQRAMLAVAVLPHYEAEAKQRLVEGGKLGKAIQMGETGLPGLPGKPLDSAQQAGEKLGVTRQAVAQAKAISLNAPDLAAAVKAGTSTLNEAWNTMKKIQAASPGAYDGSKAHESEPEKLAERFTHGVEAACSRLLDLVKEYADLGTEVDAEWVKAKLDHVVKTAEKTFTG